MRGLNLIGTLLIVLTIMGLADEHIAQAQKHQGVQEQPHDQG